MTTFLVCLFAGLGAGLGTGFAGMSAAAVISPMLIAFLDMEPYQAIGIALASDVLASAVSAYTYGKNKNLDVKNGLVMMVTVMIFTFISSYAASFVPSNTMGGFSGPAIFPIALRMVYQVSHAVNIPVIGMGGVSTAEDVIEMMYAGATAVQVGAANLKNPYACKEIIEDLPKVMEKYGIKDLNDIIGKA